MLKKMMTGLDDLLARPPKGNPATLVCEQERQSEIRDPQHAPDWLVWKFHGTSNENTSILHISHVMAVPELWTLAKRCLPIHASPHYHPQLLPCCPALLRTHPKSVRPNLTGGRHARGRTEGHSEEGRGERGERVGRVAVPARSRSLQRYNIVRPIFFSPSPSTFDRFSSADSNLRLMRFVSFVLSGVKYLHGHGIVHRNIKSLVFLLYYSLPDIR